MNKQRQKTDSSTGSLVAIFTWFCPTKLYLSHVECHIFYHDFSLQKKGAHVKVIPGLDVSYLNRNKLGMRPSFFWGEQIRDVWGLHCAISKSSIPKLQKRTKPDTWNYNSDFIKLNTYRNTEPNETTNNPTPLTKTTIRYSKGTSETTARILQPYDIDAVHKPITTLWHIVNNVKDKCHPHDRQRVVYRIKCTDCQAT